MNGLKTEVKPIRRSLKYNLFEMPQNIFIRKYLGAMMIKKIMVVIDQKRKQKTYKISVPVIIIPLKVANHIGDLLNGMKLQHLHDILPSNLGS